MLTPYASCCDRCAKVHLERTRTVKAYLSEHPRASLIELYQATGVPLRTLKEIVRVV